MSTNPRLEERLRELHDRACFCDVREGFGCRTIDTLRAAAAIGAELAFEEAASIVEMHEVNNPITARSRMAVSIRAAAQRARDGG
jgi:hypothetical protein